MIRRALRILLGLVVAGALLLAALGLWLHLGGARWAVNRALRAINPYPGTSLAVGSVRGNLLRAAEVRNLEFRSASGEVPTRVERIGLRYSLGDLLGDEITVDEIDIAGVTIRLKRRPDGTWELPDRSAGKPGEKKGNPPRIRVRRLLVEDVTLTAGQVRVTDLTFRARDLAIAQGVDLGVDTVAFQVHPPDPFPALTVAGSGSFLRRRLTVRSLGVASATSSVAVQGTAVVRGGGIRGVQEIDLTASAPTLTLRDLRGLNPRFDRPGGLTLDLRARGSAEHLSYRLAAALDSGGGTLEATGVAPLPGVGPGTYSTDARARRIDVARIAGGDKPLDPLDAEVQAELSGESLTHLDGKIRLKARGPVAGTLDARFVDGEADFGLSAELDGSRADFRGKVRPFDSLPSYRLRGTWRPPQRFAKGKLSPIQLRIDGRGGAANVWTTLELAGGKVAADGRVVLGSPVQYTVTRGILEGVGIPEGDSLNARFTLRGAGVEPSSMAAQGRVDLLSSTIAGRRIDSVRTDLTLRNGRLDVRGRGMVEETAVSVEADARPFEPMSSVRVHRAELTALKLQRLFPALGLTTHADVIASGTLVGGVATIEADVRDSSGRVTLAATARSLDRIPSLELREVGLEDVNLARLLNDPKFETRLNGRLTGSARGTGMGDAAATATLDLAGSEVRGRLLRTGRADLAFDHGQLRVVASAGVDADSLQVSGTMDSSTAVLHASGSVRGARVDSAATVLRLGEHRRVDTLWVQSNFGMISGSGTPTNLRIAGQLTDIRPLGPLIGLDSLATDSLFFTAALGGPDDSLSLNVTGRALDLSVNENRVGEVNVGFVGRVDSTRRSLESGTGILTLKGFTRGNAALASAALRAAYKGGEVGITADAVVDRDRGARIVAQWVPGDSGLIHLDTVDLRTPVGPWGLAHPVEIQYGDRLSVGDLVLASGTQRIAVDGDIDRRGEQSLHATVKSVRFGPLVEVLGVRNLDGLVDGDFDLQGPAASPRAVGDLSVRFLSAAKRLGRVRGALDWDSLGLNLDLALIPSKGDSLTVKGLVPIGLSLVEGDSAHGVVRPPSTGRLELDARTSAFRLESLEPVLKSDDIGEVKGLLSMDIAIRGTTEEPETSGSIRLRDLKVNALKLGATYKGTAEAALASRELRLTAARLRTGDGEAEVTGALRLVDSARVGVDLEANFREFQIAEARDFGSKLSGRIHLGGTSVAPELSGEVTTDNTYFYLTSDNSSSAIADVELTPEELETVERRFGSLARSREKKLGLFDASSLDLSVTLGPNNWIRRRSDPVVAVELGGAVDIKKQPRGKLDVRGDVQALTGRSFLETVGRRFELTQGGAKLKGPLETAELDLEAEYRVVTQRQSSESDVTITAEVTADTGSIALTLGSRPSMEQRDIMSYLLTGGPATTDPTIQSNSNQNYLSTGASLAVGAALGTIAGSAGQELGFDVVQILQDMQGAQTLVAGKYVSPDLYLGFRQPLSESTTDDEDPENVANVMEFEVEYAAFRKALLNLQGAGSEFRVFLRLRGGN